MKLRFREESMQSYRQIDTAKQAKPSDQNNRILLPYLQIMVQLLRNIEFFRYEFMIFLFRPIFPRVTHTIFKIIYGFDTLFSFNDYFVNSFTGLIYHCGYLINDVRCQSKDLFE